MKIARSRAIFRFNLKGIPYETERSSYTRELCKGHTSRLIADVVNNRRPAVITQNGHARVIVQDLQSYEETQESLAMLKIVAQGRDNIRKGQFKPMEKAFTDIRKQTRVERSR